MFSTFVKVLTILVSNKKAHIFLMTHGKFHSWIAIRLEYMIKMCLVMETTIKLTQIGNCNIQSCLVHPNGWTVSTEVLNLHLVGVMILQMKQ